MTTDNTIDEPTVEAPAALDEGDLFLIGDFAKRYHLPPTKVIGILNATAFKLDKNGAAPTNAQTIALIVVCNTYGLNPFTKEIFAFPDKKGVIPVVSVDGWIRIINERPELDGFTFAYSDDVWNPNGLVGLTHEAHDWIECTIFRRDRAKPTVVREYLEECYKAPGSYGAGPWQSHTNRFLRHKALIQCARYAFGFAGIYDADEAQNILRASVDDEDVDPAMAAALPAAPLVEMPTRKEPAVVADPPAVPVIAAEVTERKARKEHVDQETGEITMDAPHLFPAEDGNSAKLQDFQQGMDAVDAPAAAAPSAPAAAPAAAPAQAATKVDPKRLEYLRMRMEFNGVEEEALEREFAGGLEAIKTMTELAKVGNWIESQGAK